MIVGYRYKITKLTKRLYKRLVYKHACDTCGRFFESNVNALYCKNNCSPSKRARKRIEKRKGSNRIPKWQCKKQLEQFYKDCPQGYVVDHIVPLNHKDISGLHVLTNLQYLTREDNGLKSNKWDGTRLNDTWRVIKS